MNDDDHRELVEMVLGLSGMCVLSCYWDNIYSPLLKSKWKRLDFPTVCSCAGRTRLTGLKGKGICKLKQPRLETVLISPRTVKLLNMN